MQHSYTIIFEKVRALIQGAKMNSGTRANIKKDCMDEGCKEQIRIETISEEVHFYVGGKTSRSSGSFWKLHVYSCMIMSVTHSNNPYI